MIQTTEQTTRRFQEIADDVLAHARCTVTWTDDREGTADRERRHITAPRLDGDDPIGSMAVFLHEVGHVAGPQDYPLGGKWHGEVAATLWALRTWELNDLPGYERAEYCLGERLAGYLRTALADGKATVEEIRDFVPSGLMPLESTLRVPEYLHETTEAQALRAVNDDKSKLFPAGMTQTDRFRFLRRLQEWR